jgi:signal transduction histidine kinase
VTLRHRLLLAQVPLAAALLLVGAASLRTVTELGEGSEGILKDNYRSVLAAQRMGEALEALDRDAVLRAAGRPAGPEGDPRLRFEAELAVQEGNVTEPGEAQVTRRLRAAWAAYLKVQAAAGSTGQPLAAYLAEVQPASRAVRRLTGEILDLNQDAMVRKSNQARRTAERHLQLMLAATLAALVLGLLASVALTTRMVRPLSALSQAVRRFGEGDLESRARPRGHDEIAALGREFDTMADRLGEYRRSSLGELLRAQQAAQAAIDALPDPVFVVDPGGRIQDLNRAAEGLLHLPSGEGVGRSLELLEPGLRERLAAVRAQVVGGRGPFAPRGFEDAVRVEGDGAPRHFLPRATALYGEDGGVAGAAIVLQDVTRLLRFDELKNDLVATVAHEFRTPLTSLHMAIHLTAEEAAGPITERQADLMAAARQDCERLQGIVDDLLDLSRIQAGRVALQPQDLEAGALLREAVAGAGASAQAGGVALEVEPATGPLPLRADPERVQLVLANLLGNAVRHTPAGGRVTARALAGPPGMVRIEVADTGEGIAPAWRERIFERFFQVPGARRGGVGLGLFISREIARAHGGELGVESEPGKGSTFWLTLPVDGPAA